MIDFAWTRMKGMRRVASVSAGFCSTWFVGLVALGIGLGCSSEATPADEPSQGGSSAQGSGATPSAGGSAAGTSALPAGQSAGGNAGSSSSSGGAPETGGSDASSGGVPAVGGVSGSGGASGSAGGAAGTSATGGVSGAAGAPATGGAAGAGGAGGTGGAPVGGSAGAGGTGVTAPTFACYKPTWPTATGETTVKETINVPKEYDGGLKRHNGNGGKLGIDCSGQDEQSSVEPLFELENGATLKNVIFGKYAADGVHCKGSCTLENVWWEDICDDAATFLGTSASTVVRITGGGARHGADKTFQHNGGGTVYIKNFYADDVGKLYRSCGTCDDIQRKVELTDVSGINISVQLVAMNSDNNDTAKLTHICTDASSIAKVCGIYVDNDHVSNGPDAKTCLYSVTEVKRFQ